MVRLVATKRMTYNHRRLEVGDEFEVEKDLLARVFVVRRRAKIAPERPKQAATAPKPEPKVESKPEAKAAPAITRGGYTAAAHVAANVRKPPPSTDRVKP